MTHLLPLLCLLSTGLDLRDDAPRGRYLEARTASVYAGACHYGSEATTSGREAVLVWHFEAGRHRGVDLAGVDVAAVVAGDANLADGAIARRATLFVSDTASRAARDAAADLVAARHAQILGRVLSVEPAPIRATFEGDRYSVAAGTLFAIEGGLMPDRACCKMPYNVWYRPFAPVTGEVVGCNRIFRCKSATFGRSWSRADENTSFAGAFRL